VNILAQDFFKDADTVILMSATLIDHAMFASTLGIEQGQYKYIEVDSEFDPDQSPIYCNTKIRLNYKNIESQLPKLIKMASTICDHFKDKKGIIHTHSFKITEALIEHIKGQKRFLIRSPGSTNETILQEHFMREDGTVLISPSLGFGTDLKDEFGRFSIIMKTPYLPLGSERIKRLAKRSQQWYEMKALVNLVQMCGRTTRSDDDHSDTYILDATALDLIKRNKNHLPQFFLKRLH
jgi:ATP-dependent DNA helicase DinG